MGRDELEGNEDAAMNAKRTVRVAFFHLETCEPHPTNPDRSVLIPHAEAKYKTADFELDAEECRSIRLRSGPRGKLLLWAKHEEGCLHSRSIVYDWKAGVPVAVSVAHSPKGGGLKAVAVTLDQRWNAIWSPTRLHLLRTRHHPRFRPHCRQVFKKGPYSHTWIR